jgi:hypothetical protein
MIVTICGKTEIGIKSNGLSVDQNVYVAVNTSRMIQQCRLEEITTAIAAWMI